MYDFLIENIRSLNKENIIEILKYRGDKQQELCECARYVRDNGKFGKNVDDFQSSLLAAFGSAIASLFSNLKGFISPSTRVQQLIPTCPAIIGYT